LAEKECGMKKPSNKIDNNKNNEIVIINPGC
jgi:hypothetical protein